MLWLAFLAPSLIVVAVLTLLEVRAGRSRGDWLVNLQAWAISIFAGLTVYELFKAWQGPALIDGAVLPLWLGIVLFIVVQDLAEFLFHRAQHRVPFLWAMHSLHHSDPDMSALTASRHFWGDRLVKTFTVWSLAAMVITPTVEAVAVYFVLSLWHFAVHSNLDLDFGKWTWVINGPAYHRRHHSRLPEHYNCNFAALFPIFDVLTGSYQHPHGRPETGLEHRPANAAELLLWPFVYRRREAAVQRGDAEPARLEFAE